MEGQGKESVNRGGTREAVNRGETRDQEAVSRGGGYLVERHAPSPSCAFFSI